MEVDQKTLDDYKKKVAECLMKNYNRTEARAWKSITLYTEDFPMFCEEKWEPSLAATAIVLGY